MNVSSIPEIMASIGRREGPLIAAVAAMFWLTSEYVKQTDVSPNTKLFLFAACVGAAFLLAFILWFLGRTRSPRPDTSESPGGIQTFVDTLTSQTREQLNAHIEEYSIPAPPARASKQDIVIHILRHTPCESVCDLSSAAKPLPSGYDRLVTILLPSMYVLVASIALILALYATLLKPESRRLSLEHSNVITTYYSGIDRGIQAKDDAGWKQAWESCTKDRQQKFLRGYPDYADHRVFGVTYKNSGTHNLMYISTGDRISDSEYAYTVVYEERKGILANELYFMVWPQTETRVNDFLGHFPNGDALTNYLLKQFEKYYAMKSSEPTYRDKSEQELRELVKQALSNLFVNRALDPDLFFNVASKYGLNEKPLSATDPVDSNKKFFFVRYVVRIEVVKEKLDDGKEAWKIRKFAPQGQFLTKVNP